MSGSEHTFDRVPKRPGTIPEDGAPGYDAGYDVGYQDAGCEDGSEYDEPYGGSAYAGSEEGEFEFVRADDGLNDGPDADPIGDQDDDLEAPDDPEDGSEPDSDEDQDGWADPETGYAGTGPGSGHADRGWNEIPDDGIFYADLPGTDGARDAADELDMNSIGLNTCPPEAGHGLNGFNGSSERQNRQGLQGGMAAGFGPDAMGANGMDHAGMGADPRDPGRLADVFSDAAGQADAAGRMDLASAAEPRPRGRSLLPLCAAVLTAATAGAAVWFGAQGEGPLAEPVRHARAVIEAAAGVTGVPLPFASETHEAGRTEAGRTGTGSPEAARPGA
ncbi:MAG: hypothetical protein Q4F72_12580, partial [Desulfovibrionaceae bacterium]|nr:hypothetical protein [Desulfovibrionaceae bacterium]